jgi:methyl-accepting chemotaxis protein
MKKSQNNQFRLQIVIGFIIALIGGLAAVAAGVLQAPLIGLGGNIFGLIALLITAWLTFRGLNKIEEEHNEEVHWYVGILDAIPFPLSVTDMNMNWTFINHPVEQFLKVKREDIIGHQCSEWNADICKTENCGIARLRKNYLQTFFSQMGGHFQVDTSYLNNVKGERIGHIEVVQDITRLMSAQQYQDKAIDSVAGYLDKMAQGDLSFEISELPAADKNTEEVRKNFIKIQNNLKTARGRLQEALKSVQDNANKVSAASRQLASAANQASDATTQIATTMNQVAKGTTQQAQSISRTSQSIEQMAQAIQSVSAGSKDQEHAVDKAFGSATQLDQFIQKMADVSKQNASSGSAATATSRTGEQTVKGTIQAIDGIRTKVGASAERVREMGKRSAQIGAIVETIDDIAAQTNLLALNAAIEAARAGEQGKGFAVVADEVRKLAERSSAATKEIGELVHSIQAVVQEAVQSMDEGLKEIDHGVERAGDAGQALNSVLKTAEEVYLRGNETMQVSSQAIDVSKLLVDAMQSVSEVAKQNNQTTQTMTNISNEAMQAVENIASISEENSAAVEEVSASTEEMSAQVEEVNASAQSLAEMAEMLQKVVSNFKLR